MKMIIIFIEECKTKEYRKKEKVENKNDPEKEGLNTVIGHSNIQ